MNEVPNCLKIFVLLNGYVHQGRPLTYCLERTMQGNDGHNVPFYPSLILVQPRKTRPDITEKLLIGT